MNEPLTVVIDSWTELPEWKRWYILILVVVTSEMSKYTFQTRWAIIYLVEFIVFGRLLAMMLQR